MNPSTRYTDFKKIHLFLRSLVEGHFLFYFHFMHYFLDLFFANSSRCKWRPCAIKFGDTVHVIIFPHTLLSF
jgi:hypothetical protein